jgi:hypothetical protein
VSDESPIYSSCVLSFDMNVHKIMRNRETRWPYRVTLHGYRNINEQVKNDAHTIGLTVVSAGSSLSFEASCSKADVPGILLSTAPLSAAQLSESSW